MTINLIPNGDFSETRLMAVITTVSFVIGDSGDRSEIRQSNKRIKDGRMHKNIIIFLIMWLST